MTIQANDDKAGSHTWLELSLRANKVKNADGFMGRKVGNPFFRLETLPDDTTNQSQVIAESEVIMNTPKPAWPIVRADLHALTQIITDTDKNDPLTTAKFRIVVYDWAEHGYHQYIGALTTDVQELIQKAERQVLRKNEASFELRHERKNSHKKEFRGNLFVTAANVTQGAPPEPDNMSRQVTLTAVPADPSESYHNDNSISSLGRAADELDPDDDDDDDKKESTKSAREKYDANATWLVEKTAESVAKDENSSPAELNAYSFDVVAQETAPTKASSSAQEVTAQENTEADGLRGILRRAKEDTTAIKSDLVQTNKELKHWQTRKEAAETECRTNEEEVRKIREEIDQYKKDLVDLERQKTEAKSARNSMEAETQEAIKKVHEARAAKETALEEYAKATARRDKVKSGKEATIESQAHEESDDVFQTQASKAKLLTDRKLLVDIENESDKVRKDIVEKSKALDDLTEKRDVLAKEIEAKRILVDYESTALEIEIRQLQEKIKDDKLLLQTDKDKYENQMADRKAKSEEAEARLLALDQEIREIEAKLLYATSKKETADTDLATLEKEILEMGVKLEKAEQDKESAVTEFSKKCEELEKIKQDIEEKRLEVEQSKLTVDDTEKIASESRETVQNDLTVKHLKEQVEEIDEAKAAAMDECTKASAELEKIQRDSEAKSLEIEREKNRLAEMTQELETTLMTYQSAVSETKVKTEQAKADKDTATDEYDALCTELDGIKQQIANKRAEIEETSRHLVGVVKAADDRGESKPLSEVNETRNIEEKIESSRLQKEKAQLEHDTLRAELESLWNQIEAMRGELESASERAGTMAKALEEGQANLLDIEEATRRFSEKIVKARQTKQATEESYAKESAALEKLMKEADAGAEIQETAIHVTDEDESAGETAFTPRSIGVGGVPITSRPQKSSEEFLGDTRRFWLISLLTILPALVLAMIHSCLCQPISLGDVVRPGIILYKNGILGMLPVQIQPPCEAVGVDCDKAYVRVQAEVVTAYDNNGNMTWKIVSDSRSAKRVCNVNDDESCEHGLHFTEDRHLLLSGVKIAWIETFADDQGHHVHAHPWPFAEKPLARALKSNK